MAKCIVISKMTGMKEWAEHHIGGIASRDFSVEVMDELKIDAVQSGNVVVGSLSFEDVLNINMAGATYKHLTFDIKPKPDSQMTELEIEKHRPFLNEYFVSTSEFSMVNSKVGEWDAFIGEYANEHDVQSKIDNEGVLLRMGSRNNNNPLSKKIFVERMENTWKITLSSNANKVEVQATVNMFDSGSIAMYNCFPAIKESR